MRALPRVGGAEVEDARLLATTERATGIVPEGCAWLDERTIEDLDLPLVFRTIERTTTPSGAQVLWRWLTAPALAPELIADRERKIALLGGEGERAKLRRVLESPAGDAPHLPRLLWEAAPPRPQLGLMLASIAGLVGSAALALVWPAFVILAMLIIAVNVLVDDWANLRLANQARALEVLGSLLGTVERVAAPGVLPAELGGAAITQDLAAVAPLRKRIRVLAVKDPLQILDFVRGALLVRLFTLVRCADLLAAHRTRLRRLVLWLGELDAMTSVAALRAERPDAHVAELTAGGRAIAATDLIHPAVADAIGNDLALDGSLLITGSNMSGKSTFLRAVAINAILAQSIHTTFGTWRGPIVRVRSVMRIADDTEAGQSKFAVEVAAIAEVLAVVAEPGPPALLVLDEPFGGTNPAIRVPIVVAVLDHLAEHHVVLAATHDLDVAAQVGGYFTRGYFADTDDGSFDRKLRPGVAPSSNAVALLRRAGYPAAILARIEGNFNAAGAGRGVMRSLLQIDRGARGVMRPVVLLGVAAFAACAAGSPSATAPHAATSSYVTVHIDSLAPENVAAFETARRDWVGVLHAAHASDQRGTFYQVAGVGFVTLRPFGQFADLDARPAARKRALAPVPPGAQERYDERSDALLGSPHRSEIWQRDPDFGFGTIDEHAAGSIEMVIEDLKADSASEHAYEAVWREMAAALAAARAPLTRITYESVYGAGRVVTLWLAPVGGSTSLETALIAALGEAPAAALLVRRDAVVLHSERHAVVRRDDLSSP